MFGYISVPLHYKIYFVGLWMMLVDVVQRNPRITQKANVIGFESSGFAERANYSNLRKSITDKTSISADADRI